MECDKTTQRDAIEALAPDAFQTVALVTGELGLHARPAALLAQTAQRFDADIVVSCGGRAADGKSILDILSLAAVKGSSLTVCGRGRDALPALRALQQLMQRQFRE
jgi:phosphotransferase system HPr (HPr) family protein